MERILVDRLWDWFWSLFFPSKCAVCGEIIDFDAILCEECENSLGIIGENCCEKCGKPPEDCICGRYHQYYEVCTSAVELYEAGKKIVYDFKFENQTSMKRQMALLMAKAVKLRFGSRIFDFVVAVPMTKSAVRKRSYNQSEVLAKELSKLLGQEYAKGLLIKTHKTPHQASLNAKERLTNLSGAIGINEKFDVTGKDVLVVDDIITTGATVNECAKVLLENGASSVCCVSFATTVRENS